MNILSVIVKKWYNYIGVWGTCCAMRSRQIELMDMLYFMMDFKNKSYQVKFFKILWVLYVLENMKCNDWLLLCQKVWFL